MPNPFFFGGHVQPDQFVGRKAELRRIFSALETAHTGQLQSVSVVGPRRIGKSSLLYYVANRFAQHLSTSKNYRCAYIDLQDASTLTPDGLHKKILDELGAPYRGNTKLTLAKFQDAIIALKGSGVLPVILLDEFEQVLDHAGLTAPDIFDSWRYLMNANAAAFITASKIPLADLAQSQKFTSPFFNVFTYLPLGELTNDEARKLIARGAECECPFTPTEQYEAWTMAGNHPYKLQLAGSLLYQAKADGGAIDWTKLRNDFVQQLKQVGLEADMKRTIKMFGRNSKDTVTSATKSGIGEIFKAFLDYITHPKP